MKKSILAAALLSICAYTSNAQFKISQDLNGTPIETRVAGDVVGSIYLYDDFYKGHALEENNTYYDNLDLRYDIQADRVSFKNKYGVEFAFKNPIKEFKISRSKTDPQVVLTFRNGFPPIAEFTEKSYYQVLNDGNTVALKKLKKSIVESTPYGLAKTQKNFVTSEQYFIFLKGKMIKIKRDKKSIIEALDSHKEELSRFIGENALSFKKDEDLSKLVDYYNTL